MEEAGSAVVVLTQRAADETVGQTRVLFPTDVPSPSVDPNIQLALENSAQPWREARLGVVAGLEPVTSSARRAVDLFLREIPPVEQGTSQR
jgi:hypothetical protein